MASKYKRTIGVVLVIVNVVCIAECLSELEENDHQRNSASKSTLVSNLPGEHLLRGSSEIHDSEISPQEMGIARMQFDETFKTNRDEKSKPLSNNGDNSENTREIERPSMGFFNTEEGKLVQVEDSDLIVDPVTGQTMIKHIHPYQQSETTNEELDYLIRPTDVALKNLQGFYVPNTDNAPVSPTSVNAEQSETAQPLLSLGSIEAETNRSDNLETDKIKANHNKISEGDTEASNQIHPDPKTQTMVTPEEQNVSTDPNFLKKLEDSANKTYPEEPLDDANTSIIFSDARDISTGPDLSEERTEIPTTMNDNTVTETMQTETHTVGLSSEESGVYKLRGTTPGVRDDSQTASDNNKTKAYNVESITRGSPARAETALSPVGALTQEDSEEVVIGARIGVDERLRVSPMGDKQRTPKIDKASPIEKRPDLRPKIKLSRRDTLRSWLEDPWLRAPAGLLLPLRASSLGRALAVWREVAEPEGLNLTDVIIVGYDANGIGWLSSHDLQTPAGTKVVTDAIQRLQLKYQAAGPSTHGGGSDGDAALHACAWAARRVPYDSALFIVTDSAPSDARRLPAALRALIDKRLKLYTVWTDPLYPSAQSAQAVTDLTKASQYTEGEFLDYHVVVEASGEADKLASARSVWRRTNYRSDEPAAAAAYAREARIDNGIRERSETLLVRRASGGNALGVPVEEGVRELRVRIDGAVERAVLYTPTGAQIDLFNASSVRGFAPGSRLESLSPLEALLQFPETETDDSDTRYAVLPPPTPAPAERHRRPTVGVWRLSVRCEACEYRVAVSALAPIALDATMLAEDELRLRVRGPVASVRETTLVDEYGAELAKLPFSHQPSASEQGAAADLGDGAGLPALVADVPLPPLKRTGRVYARVVGRDVYGEPFARLAGPIFKPQEARTSRSAAISFPDKRSDALQSTFNFPGEQLDVEQATDRSQRLFFGSTNNDSTVLPASTATSQITSQAGTLLTTVQIGLSSRLYGTPGDNLQIHFEVSNYRDRSINFRFEASGNLRFLRGIRPTTQWISSGQTANVIVDVGITTSAQLGARDLITFTATGLEQVSISAYVYVVNSELLVTDTWAPNVRHTFQGDCMAKQGDECARHTWAATVYARDNDGGLLRLSSSPVGLRYESNFISGTRAEVAATYRATCCAPRILVNAVDANGNANTYTVDISQYIPDAAIAAIVLGVLLLIAIICLVAFLVYVCVRRRNESRQLLSYSTARRET